MLKQRVLSAALALCLCLSAAPQAYARQDVPLPQANFRAAEYTAEPAPRETAGNLTEQEAYNRMIALQKTYPTGTEWTNSTPYTMSNSYNWKGGSAIGVSGGVGCAAFAFILSDTAFGSLPATMKQGNIQLSDVHVGDILRLNGGAHTVIVLRVSGAGVVIAEGNYNKSVHWGRTLTKAEVEAAAALITRYPEGTPLPDDSSPNGPMKDENGTELKGALEGGLTWKLTNSNTLTISGTGAMPDYSEKGQPWSAYLNRILNIEIGSGVTRVGNNAFRGSKAISVTIPEGVTEIGENAFRACEGLSAAVLPASVEKVGAGAFESSGLTYATFTDGDKKLTVGNGIFAQCWRLASVSLPQNIDCIGENMFSTCSSLSSLYIPKSVAGLGINAFTQCGALTDIYFGGSETEWDALLTVYTRPTFQGKKIHYNSPLPSPFDSADPFIDDGTGDNPDHTHIWDNGTVTQEPDCTSGGIRTYTCTAPDCGKTKTETIPALGHDYGAWQTVTQATTTSNGLQKRTCNRCGNEETKTIPAINPPVHTHSYGSPVVTKAAACTEPGERTLRCSCGRTRTETIPALGHSYGAFIVTKEATCTESGEQTSACSNCGDTQTETIPAVGHEYGAFAVTKEATCTEPGEQTSTCSNCGDTQTETIPAAGHEYSAFAVTKEATCTEPGEQTAVCANCGDIKTEVIPATGHSYSPAAVTKEATCTEPGEQTSTCANCGDIKTEVIPAAGHSYGPVTVIKEVTCIEDGQQTSTCSRCGDTLAETVRATGHNFVVNAGGDYECSNERNAAGNSATVVNPVVADGYKEVVLRDWLTSAYACQNAATASRYVSGIIRDTLASVSNLLSYTINTISYTPPIQAVDGEYIYTVTLRFNGRAAATVLTTEPLHLAIPADAEADPNPVPDPIPDAEREETYYISIPKTTGGDIIPSTRYAAQGERVSLSVRPDTGYELSELTVSSVWGRNVSVRDLGDGRYSFTMPSSRVEVSAVFSAVTAGAGQPDSSLNDEIFTGLGTPGISGIVLNPSPMPFTDVPASSWYYNSVDYAWKHYLMSGVSETQFAPGQTTSRAMIWTILARTHNVRTDINPGSTWYEKGMLWAVEQGVTDGSDPMGDITREQLAVMLWRNAGSMGGGGDLSQFSDTASISGYAVSAMQWAVSRGILRGDNGQLNPKGTATRAEVAAMIMRYADAR